MLSRNFPKSLFLPETETRIRCEICGCFKNESGCLSCLYPEGRVRFRCYKCQGNLDGWALEARELHIRYCRGNLPVAEVGLSRVAP